MVQCVGEEGQKKGCGYCHVARPCPTTQGTKYRISLTQKRLLMYNKGERTRAGVSLSSEYPPQHYHGIRTMGVKKLCQKMRTPLLLSCAYVSCPQNGNSQIHSVAEHPAMFISGQIEQPQGQKVEKVKEKASSSN